MQENIKRPLIFEVDAKGYVHDDRTKWFTEFKNLTKEEMTYVALVQDYNSPYFGNPKGLKETKVAAKIKHDTGFNITHDEKIDHAVALYGLIQYDSVAEQLQSHINLLDVYTRELNKITAMGSSNQDVQKIDKAIAVQQKSEKEIDRLEKKQRERIIEDSKTRGDRVTNFYEVWREKNDVERLAMKGIENYLDATK